MRTIKQFISKKIVIFVCLIAYHPSLSPVIGEGIHGLCICAGYLALGVGKTIYFLHKPQIFEEIDSNNLGVIKEMVKLDRQNLYLVDALGNTPLLYAFQTNKFDIVTYLLAQRNLTPQEWYIWSLEEKLYWTKVLLSSGKIHMPLDLNPITYSYIPCIDWSIRLVGEPILCYGVPQPDDSGQNPTDHLFENVISAEKFTPTQKLLFAASPTSKSLMNKIENIKKESSFTKWLHKHCLISRLSKKYLAWQFVSPVFSSKFNMLLKDSIVSLDDLEPHLSQEVFEEALVAQSTHNISTFLEKCVDNQRCYSAKILLKRFNQALENHKSIWARYVHDILVIRNRLQKIRTERISRYATILSHKQLTDSQFTFA